MKQYTWLLSGYNQRRIRDQEKLAGLVGKYNMIVGIAAAAGSVIDHPDTMVIFPFAVIGHVALAAYANARIVYERVRIKLKLYRPVPPTVYYGGRLNYGKTFFLFILVLVIGLAGCSNVEAKTDERPPKKVCIEEYKERTRKFNKKILDDIISSFDLGLDGFKEVTFDDLSNNMKIGEKNEGIRSLMHLFVGNSLGDMRLFLNGNRGYFLYKRPDGNNVLKEIKQISNGSIWVVMNEQEVKGKKVEWGKKFDWSRCKEE